MKYIDDLLKLIESIEAQLYSVAITDAERERLEVRYMKLVTDKETVHEL